MLTRDQTPDPPPPAATRLRLAKSDGGRSWFFFFRSERREKGRGCKVAAAAGVYLVIGMEKHLK